MDKIIIITPHLSTGGLPQYLLKKIELLTPEYEFYIIEWEDITGGIFVVQKNKLKKILGDKLISLSDNKFDVLFLIKNIKPDIIHFEEIPETFIDNKILDILYSNDRDYKIVCTTHSSLTNPINIKYTADKFILVSEWSMNIFNNFYKGDIPCEVWEYPIDYINYDKIMVKKELGFDDGYFNVLNVGLFTENKNQKEIIDIARLMTNFKIKFHFVGNQAMNFSDYWGPLMKNLPNNCICYGERSDVDKFYMASDLFYFPSKFELNPLSVKEALMYNLPILMKKLDTYGDIYLDKVTYISDDIENNKNLLIKYVQKYQ